MKIKNSIHWLAPWEPCVPDGDGLIKELRREVGDRHSLNGIAAEAVARRRDRDDVLFVLEDPLSPLAVVHLTWSMHQEEDPRFPWTEFFASWEDWIERRMVPDHREDLGQIQGASP